jgi:hypothetical protein
MKVLRRLGYKIKEFGNFRETPEYGEQGQKKSGRVKKETS